MIYARLDEAIEDLNSRLGGLPRPAKAEDIWDDLWHQEAHHSTALEGNTLILDQVRKLLDEGRAVGSKELREYMEVKGYTDAARWVYGQAWNRVIGPAGVCSASKRSDRSITRR